MKKLKILMKGSNEEQDDNALVDDDPSRTSSRELQTLCNDHNLKAGGKRNVVLNRLEDFAGRECDSGEGRGFPFMVRQQRY